MGRNEDQALPGIAGGWAKRPTALILCAIFCLSVSIPVSAAELYSNGDLTLRWDNTFKYSAAFRIRDPAPSLVADVNADDGNRNFRAGLISNRFDLLSELGLRVGNVGVEASAAAWYDTVYNQRTDNDWPSSFNSTSTSYHSFTPAVRRLHGRKVDLLNAFAYGSFNAGDVPIAVRAGRSTVIWGESLFFAGNGIAAGQAPVDAIKGLSVPNSRAKEVYMPVAQLWLGVQPRPGLSIEAYYQFEWRKNRLPGAGSYFSAADFIDAGGERVIVGPGQFFARTRDKRAPDTGQYGIAIKFSGDGGDYGLYALRYHAKDPQLYLRLGPLNGTTLPPGTLPQSRVERSAAYGYTPGVVIGGASNPIPTAIYGLYGDPVTGEVGNYDFAYPRGIQVYGASFSGYLGNGTIAGEISGRRNMPLVSKPLVLLPNVAGDANRNPLYAVGDSLHAQLSTVMVLRPSSWWPGGATFAAEIAANRRMGISRNAAALDPTRTRAAVSMRVAFEPQYFSVMPGLDLSIPMGVGYGIAGRSSVDQSQNAKAGDVEIGLAATYRSVWIGQLTFTHFFGPVSHQPFADRGFIAISVQRTF